MRFHISEMLNTVARSNFLSVVGKSCCQLQRGLRWQSHQRIQRALALLLSVALVANPVLAGILVTGSNGITATGVDGIFYNGTSGITATGVDGLLAFGVNGITATGVDGVPVAGANGATYTGVNGITATGVDGLTMNRATGITATGVDGITATGVDGKVYYADSLLIRQVNGITATGVDGITATGVDDALSTGPDSFTIGSSDGITATGVDSFLINTADGITATGVDGTIFSIPPNGVLITGADGITATGVDGITATGVDSVTGLVNDITQLVGLQSLDPELAILLNRLTDDSNVNAAIVYHRTPTETDLNDLRALGILGGTRYHVLPVIVVIATKGQLIAASRLGAVRSIYGNRTLQTLADPGRGLTGVERVRTDADLKQSNGGASITGRGVTVAVLDTGLNGLHADLSGRVAQNVKLAGTLGLGLGFNYPISLENQWNTDLLSGHGTFVGGVIAGNGARSDGKYTGVAPGARLLGLSAGDLNLFYVLEGLDYLLWRGPGYGVKVVNCSFSANTVYDANDPVNVGTKLLTERGINVVFSAGNTGPGLGTLNPYAMAPWVISVGATDARGRLADFSSRGDFRLANARPTVVAPGVNIVSLRSNPLLSVTGVLGIQSGVDLQLLKLTELPYYTTSSGTSFSAPQVAGTIALMLEANPNLTPAEVRDILQRSATPLPPHYAHEVGAGLLNAHAAVLEAKFAQRRMGQFRAALERGQVRFVNDPAQAFSGIVQPGSVHTTNLSVPAGALLASVRIAWGPTLSLNDLGLSLLDPSGVKRAESNELNLPGLTGKRESVIIQQPAAGTWRAQVRHTIGLLGTAQSFAGALETTHVEYAPLSDLQGLSTTAREEIYQTLRSFVLMPLGSRFRPSFSVSRYDLATALVQGGRVPQYMAGQARFTDVRDALTRLMVESAQAAPVGPLFYDAMPGNRFRPDDRVDRLTAVIALVRAAGLRAEADAKAGAVLPFTDASLIPSQYRGYVAVALARGLWVADGATFRPASALTRAELAHAMATLMNLATE
jgi:serine protease AprX